MDKTITGYIEELENHIEELVEAINQGTKKFSYKEAPFLHEAMSKHFEFTTGISIDELLEEDGCYPYEDEDE